MSPLRTLLAALFTFSALLVPFAPSTAHAAKYRWKSIEGPIARDGAPIVYDETRQRAVLFGGFSSTGVLNDTWEWNGDTWLSRAPFTSPSPRALHSAIYDTFLGRVGLYGGIAAEFNSDISIWDGSSWKLDKQTGPTPPQRTLQVMAFDRQRKVWILFGGLDVGGRPLNDTWEYSTETHTWVERTPAVSPDPRSETMMSFDSTRNVAIVVGGVGGPFNSDTWAWDGVAGTWTLVTTNDIGIRARAALAYDPVRDRTVMFGGYFGVANNETWEMEWTGPASATWVKKTPATSPTAYRFPFATFDTIRKRVLMYGNIEGDSGLWEWDGTNWEQRGPGGLSPLARGFPSTSFDSDRKEWMLFGGTTGIAQNDTWEWNGSSWHKRSPATVPSGRYGVGLAYDSQRKVTVMFGGDGGGDETWEWSGTNWVKRAPAASPPESSSVVFAYDSARAVSVLAALVYNNGTGQEETQTWEWNGTNWAKRAPANAPFGRYGACGAYDPIRNQMVFYGGTDGPRTTFYGDMWVYDGTNWAQKNPATSPGKRALCHMIFDPTRGKIVMFSGLSPAAESDLWEWDGTNWAQVDLVPMPVVNGIATAFGFDGEHLVTAGTTLAGAGIAILVQKTDVCTTTADCAENTYCVDGVCCQSLACGACETCNGLTPGSCTPIFNQPDPDSCSAEQACSAKAECAASNGAACTANAECASGFCVDGVCCDGACSGTCLACKASLKESNDRDGVCGAAKVGTDIRNQCDTAAQTTCGFDGTCDGRGNCRMFEKGTTCDTAATCTGVSTASAKVCDGLGACSNSPEPVECKEYRCATGIGCPTSCASDDACSDGFKCRDGVCKVVRVGCASIEDCAPGFVCDFNGQCVTPPEINNDAGCSMGGTSETGFYLVPMAWVAGAVVRRIRRRPSRRV